MKDGGRRRPGPAGEQGDDHDDEDVEPFKRVMLNATPEQSE